MDDNLVGAVVTEVDDDGMTIVKDGQQYEVVPVLLSQTTEKNFLALDYVHVGMADA